VYKLNKIPEKDTIVLGKVKKILNNGAFIDLLEYKNLEAFLPVYEVTSGKIKNIKHFIKEGDVLVLKVFDVRGNNIDVSLRRVNKEEKRKKLADYKKEIRAFKLIEQIAKENGMDPQEFFEKVFEKYVEKYGGLYDYFIEIAKRPSSFRVKLPKKIKDRLLELIKNNIKIPEVEIKILMEIFTFEGDGIERIKKLLLGAMEKDKKTNIIYLGTPKYELTIKGEDFKEIRKRLEKLLDYLTKESKKLNINFSYEEIKE
jgi:translation initiation factor 2 subunit 1